MPLKSGKSAKTREQNIKEMVEAFKAKGSIGNTKPKNMKKAIQIATAAAYAKQRKT